MFTIGGVVCNLVGFFDEFAFFVEVVTNIVVSGREMFGFLVPMVIDKSGSMEEAAGDVNGNRADGFEGVTQKAGNDGLVVIEGFNGRGAEELDETLVFDEDGSGLWDESMKVIEVEVRVVEGVSKLLASRTQIHRGHPKLLTEQARSEGMMLALKGGIHIVTRMFWVVHGGEVRENLGRLMLLEEGMQK